MFYDSNNTRIRINLTNQNEITISYKKSKNEIVEKAVLQLF